MIDIATAFAVSSQSIALFFQKPGVGYYIPRYQRPYSWDSDNIERLMEDIFGGVASVDTKSTDESIRFLGTVILVREAQPIQNIQPLEPQGLPQAIYNVIDGQQRISTIAILACLLHQRIKQLTDSLPAGVPSNDEVKQAAALYLPPLLEVFSVDLLMGSPSRKPIIIRGSEDAWTLNGADTKYPSDVATFLAAAIRSVTLGTPFPTPNTKTLVGSNIRVINQQLDIVEQAHSGKGDFLPAWEIVAKIPQSDLWAFQRDDLTTTIQGFTRPPTNTDAKICSLVQLFAFSHFLLRRCCFTEIIPITERWAFDMFQSLNATGTPLTAIETFKPLVVNQFGKTYKNSAVEDDFDEVDALFKPMKTAADKSRLTREFLTTFALTYDGTEKLSSRFSEQRDWLAKAFKASTNKAEFVQRMGYLATYLQAVEGYNPAATPVFPRLSSISSDKQRIAGLTILYIEDANHALAHSVLSRFYADVLAGVPNADQEFADACGAVAAFFTLWRSALPNTGLDDAYRDVVKTNFSWNNAPGTALKAGNLKAALRKALAKARIDTLAQWKSRAVVYLRYDNAKTVCRFVLFLTAHDTISDPSTPGLMTKGTLGTARYLDPVKWEEPHCRSIEHVAPQDDKKAGWDTNLYANDDVQRIGNLILLPVEINSAVGNRGWIEKWMHYRHMAETYPPNLTKLTTEASSVGVTLGKKVVEALKKTPHQPHMTPIMSLGKTANWDKNFVDARTERICDILWDRLYNDWLS